MDNDMVNKSLEKLTRDYFVNFPLLIMKIVVFMKLNLKEN